MSKTLENSVSKHLERQMINKVSSHNNNIYLSVI
jgi:hypothetical protein